MAPLPGAEATPQRAAGGSRIVVEALPAATPILQDRQPAAAR